MYPHGQRSRKYLLFSSTEVERNISSRQASSNPLIHLLLIKCQSIQTATGTGARALAEGEFQSASAINAVVPGFVPNVVGWGEYISNKTRVYFYLGEFHEMDPVHETESAHDMNSVEFTARIAELHPQGASPNGMFGFPVSTVCGKTERVVTWEKSWGKLYARQLKLLIKKDNVTNGHWPEFDAACRQTINKVIPRLLGVRQSNGRKIRRR